MHQHDAIRSWDSDGLPANEPMSIGADIIPIKTAIGVVQKETTIRSAASGNFGRPKCQRALVLRYCTAPGGWLAGSVDVRQYAGGEMRVVVLSGDKKKGVV
jgi:hypothetical protein